MTPGENGITKIVTREAPINLKAITTEEMTKLT